jgi:hypothetical protein
VIVAINNQWDKSLNISVGIQICRDGHRYKLADRAVTERPIDALAADRNSEAVRDLELPKCRNHRTLIHDPIKNRIGRRHLFAVTRDHDLLAALSQIEQGTERIFGLKSPDLFT